MIAMIIVSTVTISSGVSDLRNGSNRSEVMSTKINVERAKNFNQST